MRTYHSDASPLRYASPSIKFLVLGGLALTMGLVFLLGYRGLAAYADVPLLGVLVQLVGRAAAVCLTVSAAALVAAVVAHFVLSDSVKIRNKVRRGLCCPACGNPLGLQDGELLPRVKCRRKAPGVYEVTIFVRGCTVERVVNSASSISTALSGQYTRYAVTRTDAGEAFDKVTFQVEDVMQDKSRTFYSVEEMRPSAPAKLCVQNDTSIDLTTSGSILVAGKTRSGKTTGIISLLLQVLLAGRDECGSEVIIIDPKQAELSRLPHVVSLDKDGEARGILEVLKQFSTTIVKRQNILNDLSEKGGDAVKWWDVGMKPSFLFIDEYVALRALLPAKPVKDSDYCLTAFDSLVKRLITTGASAGCYMIISIAEASVESGGLPTMLRSAMSTKVLFRPTLEEGRLLWGGNNEKLKNFPASRVYLPGDAWFSSTDGVHDAVSFAHFPRMEFPVYQELGRLLNEYYEVKTEAPPPAEA